MGFNQVFHEISQGYRINGSAINYAQKTTKVGSIFAGRKIIELGGFEMNIPSLIESNDDTERIPDGYRAVPDIDAVFNKLALAGMYELPTNGDSVVQVLSNVGNVALLNYNDDYLSVQPSGPQGIFVFRRNLTNATTWQEVSGENEFLVPDAQFDSFLQLVLTNLSAGPSAHQANAYISLDGSNDHITFTDKGAANAGLLDWESDWTVGLSLPLWEVKADGLYMPIISSGSNSILLRRGGSNYGMYVSGNGGNTKIGANTWHAPGANGRIAFTYSGSTDKRLRYYIGQPDGTYNLRANYLVNTTAIGGNAAGSDLNIGKPVTNSVHLHAGLNNFIASAGVLSEADLEEYFQSGEEFADAAFYASLTTHAKLGEDVFPAITDSLSAMTGGELINGKADDFVPIE